MSKLLLLLIFPLLICCNQKYKGWTTIKEKEFEIRYPSSWLPQEGIMGARLILEAPSKMEADTFSENITLLIQSEPGMTLEQKTGIVENQIKSVPTMTIIKSERIGRGASEHQEFTFKDDQN